MKNSPKPPFFSIAIPTYEMGGYGEEFLEFSFNILNKQTFKDFEIIISDHSKDDTIKDLCHSWYELLDIKYLKNTHKVGGSSPNINNAMKNCNGEWIKILFQDDFLYGYDAMERLKTHIENNTNKIWFATSCEHTNDGKTMYRTFHPRWSHDIHLGNNTISSPSVITVKNVENKVFFNEDLIWLMDVEYYKNLYDTFGSPSFMYKINVVNRTWGDSVSNKLSDEIKNNEVKLITDKYN